jgi:hypothetical protein
MTDRYKSDSFIIDSYSLVSFFISAYKSYRPPSYSILLILTARAHT